MIGLKSFNMFCSITDLVSYFCGMVYSSTFSILTGLENCWCFYENSTVPVQQRFTSSTKRDNIEWYYYKRTREWVHRTAVSGKPGKRCPWMMATLVKSNGETEDLSEFFGMHRFYMPHGYIQWPTAEQMLASWSMESYEWFLGDKAGKTMMTIMDKNCEEHTFYIGLQDDDSVRAYWRTFGMNYSADSSSVPSEASSEGEEEESAEENTDEEQVEETPDEENTGGTPVETTEETTETPELETEQLPSDTVLLPESPVEEEEIVRNPMEEVD